MKFQLGQKVKFNKIVRRNKTDVDLKEFDDKEIVEVDRIITVRFIKERIGFIVGTRKIAKETFYHFNDDSAGCPGFAEHDHTDSIKVYKVAYNMAHTNFVLEEDLEIII